MDQLLQRSHWSIAYKLPKQYILFYIFTSKMRIMEYFVMPTLLSVVICHPVNMICVPCNPKLTATVDFVNEWLNDSSNPTGIRQLLNHKGTVVNRLLHDVNSEVSW